MNTAEQYQGLFNLMSKEHGLILTISEMDEIIKEARKVSDVDSKCQQENAAFKEKVDCNYCGRTYPETMCKLHPAPCQK